MAKLLMISGDRALAVGKHGAFYNTLEESHKYWERIDIICPRSIGKLVPSMSRDSNIENSLEIVNCKLEINPFGNVFIHPSPWPLIFQPFWILKKGLQIYKEQKFDLMTVHEYPPFYNGIGARLLWNKIRTPYVLEIMHIPGYPKAASIKEKIYKNLLKFLIKSDSSRAEAIRVINKDQVPDFLVKAGISKNKLVYIPAFYIDLDVFRPMPDVEKKYDLVFVARLEKNKGINLLFQAISNVKIKMPNIRLLIIGSGPLKFDLENYIKGNHLENNIEFSGWLPSSEDVARALNSAKVFISPSFNEGGPRVVLEAMACGLPIITTKVGLMPDIIKDAENGLFINWQPEQIASKIIRLLNNQNEQEKFSKAGLEMVGEFEKNKSIKNFAEKLKAFIR